MLILAAPQAQRLGRSALTSITTLMATSSLYIIKQEAAAQHLADRVTLNMLCAIKLKKIDKEASADTTISS